MATQNPNPIDLVSEVNKLSDLFNDLSQVVDNFRLDFEPPLPDDQMGRLKDESQALEDRAHYFTAQAIGLTLQAIQPNLAQIKATITQAKEQLSTLNDVSKAIMIAVLALSVGTAIAAGDPATILAATQALAGNLA